MLHLPKKVWNTTLAYYNKFYYEPFHTYTSDDGNTG